jgi:hypothetical protein
VSSFVADDISSLHAAFNSAGVTGGAIVGAHTGDVATDPSVRTGCMSTGTCIQYGRPGGFSEAELDAIRSVTSSAGNWAWYEVPSAAMRDELVAGGADPDFIQINEDINQPAVVINGT